MRNAPRIRRGTAIDDPVLPAPLEEQLELLVEDVLGDEPLAQPLPERVGDENAERRIVVTGLGVVSPVGATIDEFWDAVTGGRSGIGVRQIGGAAFLVGEVRDWPPDRSQHLSRAAQFGLHAARAALADARFALDAANADEVGVVMGGALAQHGGDTGATLLTALPHTPTAAICAGLGIAGPASTIATACAASAQAIGEAAAVLLRGDAEVMLAGGAEAALSDDILRAFGSLGALASPTPDPAGAVRPFDAERSGFAIGEGAAVLVLETLRHARARGARIYAELLGFGSAADRDLLSPDPVGDGALRSVQRAMAQANVTPQQIDYINAHATGTQDGDAAETELIKTALGEYATAVAISSTKAISGHLLGAAGAIEAVVTVLALKHGILPPTINYQSPDPRCDLDYVPNTARPAALQIAISHAFGFGGQCAALVFSRIEDRHLSPAELAIEAEFEGRLDEQ